MLIFLYGPPGVGKSTVGRHLAARLEWPLVDVDRAIEARAGMPIPDLFQRQGEKGFRALEAQTLQDLVETYAGTPGAVLALGGGALLHAPSRRLVEAHGPVVLLQASPETLAQRVKAQRGGRPLLPGEDEGALRRLLAARAAHYASFARRVTVDTLNPAEVAWQAQIQAGVFRLKMRQQPSEVLVRVGGLTQVGQELAARFPERPAVALVTDEQVGALYADPVADALRRAGFAVHLLTLPPGEGTKSLTTLTQVWAFLLEHGLDRHSLVVVLGGGVMGDLTGFAAATFMRGIPWVNLPTSLLAMVDASVGGKTAVDLPQGKNLVGAFHPPRMVLVDPTALETLPDAEWRSGLAEVVKHAVIGDPALWALLAQGMAAVQERREEVVRRALAVKVRIVTEDPFEQGIRAVLNAGHTVGHALEAAAGYALRHGEAVSIGLVIEARLAERLGLATPGWADRLQAVLAGLGLPTAVPQGLDRDQVIAFLSRDKKRRAGEVRFALPCGVGEVRWGQRVPAEVLAEAALS